MKKPPPSFKFRTDFGVDGIEVDLWDRPFDPQQAANVIASFYLSTWNDPLSMRVWKGTENANDAWRYAQDACDGKVLPNTLESLSLTYSMKGLSRATTHQMVRTRVGAVFGQQGGRDNNWSDFNLRLAPTWIGNDDLRQAAEDLQIQANSLYLKALEAGIPFQDARYILPMGLETALVGSYNLLALKGLAERRLCNRMMWETNYIVRVMCDLAVISYPFVGKNLRSSCEKRGVCGSVSPMFPPACLSYGKTMEVGSGRNFESFVRLAHDNDQLKYQIKETGYDFPTEANGCYHLFTQTDTMRLNMEMNDPNIVISLVTGDTILARRDELGLWRLAL